MLSPKNHRSVNDENFSPNIPSKYNSKTRKTNSVNLTTLRTMKSENKETRKLSTQQLSNTFITSSRRSPKRRLSERFSHQRSNEKRVRQESTSKATRKDKEQKQSTQLEKRISETTISTRLTTDETLSEADISETIDMEIDTIEDPEYTMLLFMKQLPLPPPVTKPCLPPKSKNSKITLVLDLDETLVHCSIEPLLAAHCNFTVVFNNVNFEVYARKRPYLEEFLRKVSKSFEIIVFTASQEVYASKLLDIIDTEDVISHRLYRDSCVCIDGNYIKDLNILGRDLSKIIIIDNSPIAFGFQIDNGIPITSWFEDMNDIALYELIPLLDSLSNVDDVRPIIRNLYKMRDILSLVSLPLTKSESQIK